MMRYGNGTMSFAETHLSGLAGKGEDCDPRP
jgi:hypothetical protein